MTSGFAAVDPAVTEFGADVTGCTVRDSELIDGVDGLGALLCDGVAAGLGETDGEGDGVGAGAGDALCTGLGGAGGGALGVSWCWAKARQERRSNAIARPESRIKHLLTKQTLEWRTSCMTVARYDVTPRTRKGA
jgi:hypothetical protein